MGEKCKQYKTYTQVCPYGAKITGVVARLNFLLTPTHKDVTNVLIFLAVTLAPPKERARSVESPEEPLAELFAFVTQIKFGKSLFVLLKVITCDLRKKITAGVYIPRGYLFQKKKVIEEKMNDHARTRAT